MAREAAARSSSAVVSGTGWIGGTAAAGAATSTWGTAARATEATFTGAAFTGSAATGGGAAGAAASTGATMGSACAGIAAAAAGAALERAGCVAPAAAMPMAAAAARPTVQAERRAWGRGATASSSSPRGEATGMRLSMRDRAGASSKGTSRRKTSSGRTTRGRAPKTPPSRFIRLGSRRVLSVFTLAVFAEAVPALGPAKSPGSGPPEAALAGFSQAAGNGLPGTCRARGHLERTAGNPLPDTPSRRGEAGGSHAGSPESWLPDVRHVPVRRRSERAG